MTTRFQERRWQVTAVPSQLRQQLAQACGIPPLLAGLCINRGLHTVSQIQRFLHASLHDLYNPFTMHGMEQAVERIVQALHRGERMVVYGDYDVDGVTATALLIRFFRALGIEVPYYLPHREQEGYGVHAGALHRLHAEGTTLVITVDCGISATEEMRLARSLGIDVIITDHHQCPPELPEAVAILNPHQPCCSYPTRVLSGVGVAFKLVTALRARLREERAWKRRLPNLRQHLDLVALGTIADLVPLVDENHILARQGLLELSRTGKVGLQALQKVAGLHPAHLNAEQVSFALAPRLNAAGRLETARAAVELLITEDPQQAWQLALALDRINQKRQAIQERILQSARHQLESCPALAQGQAIVLADESWHPGVIGIVASKLAAEYAKPTILISVQGDMGRGSGRSIPPLHLYEGLIPCREWLLTFGGHGAAAGLTIERRHIESFRVRFNQVVEELLGGEPFIPTLQIDAEVTLAELSPSFLEALQRLEPFGEGNPPPIFAAYDLEAIGTPQALGRGQDHLRLTVRQDSTVVPTIGFHLAHLLPAIQRSPRFSLAFTPQLNRWNGREELQLLVRDIRW
ncbi:MAG: single-stranded-DNA-specific exonuclease RecJ [Nitrospinota bacterium]|nr:MAG: single-stranded-DNA-specific exonuclease RecJ [Nitrospinota bacterium]